MAISDTRHIANIEGISRDLEPLNQRAPLNLLDRLAAGVVRHRKAIIVLFFVAALVCLPLALTVKINYNLADYLATGAQSTQAIEILDTEFAEGGSVATVMLHDADIAQALAYKRQLEQLSDVHSVTWLDDVIDVRQPLEMANQETVRTYYKDGFALLTLTLAKGVEKEAIPQIRALVGDAGAVAGDAAATYEVQQATFQEVVGAFAILLPALILILLLTTTSWLEPLLFLLAIGVSIAINMGTNVAYGQISFMTSSVSPILQMAVSLDYAIFLLHAFDRHRKTFSNTHLAMQYAIKESFTAISASATTTLFGFIALVFMQFGIGADLGLNLAKGIICSFLSVVVLLPALTLCVSGLLKKTRHRELSPSFAGAGKVCVKLAFPVALVVAVCAVPAFLGQQQTAFLYGKDNIAANSVTGLATEQTREVFGQNSTLVVLTPRGEVGRELELCEDMQGLTHVTSVIAYPITVGAQIPPQALPPAIVENFYSRNHARIIVTTNTAAEGDAAFTAVEQIQQLAQQYYGDDVFIAGQPSTLFDIKASVTSDTLKVNFIAIGAIFLVLLVSFRSLLLPLLLIFSIESAIWINLAIPYFTNVPINFIGYLVLSSVQLGATVDYAILLTSTYLRLRKKMPKNQAIIVALDTNFKSILVSAAILAICGFALNFTSTNAAVADIGTLLLRGTILSFTMVVCFLPALLLLFDRAIAKTMLRADFFSGFAAGAAAEAQMADDAQAQTADDAHTPNKAQGEDKAQAPDNAQMPADAQGEGNVPPAATFPADIPPAVTSSADALTATHTTKE
ncbi:MAG: MMPL family transporter [Coriobacteriales bacterium]|jgi:predicted RND superfamily exporter protein|nr:MMPL family transporter [Coriobacteriales bacterium]